MSDSQMVLDQLNSDPSFVVDFIIDNNPTEVQAHLTGLNLLSGTPQGDSKDSLKADIYSIDDEETLRNVLEVPYINDRSNYTGGLEYELSTPDSPIGGQQKVGGGLAIVNGILNVGGSVLGYLTTLQQTEQLEIQAELTQAQIDAQLEAQRLALEQEERNKILGVSPKVLMIIVGSFVMVVIVALVTSKK
tara:strand:- start:1441 stop:2010 length:570 start_codon:yes stop_codon:yes gene_type:complete